MSSTVKLEPAAPATGPWTAPARANPSPKPKMGGGCRKNSRLSGPCGPGRGLRAASLAPRGSFPSFAPGRLGCCASPPGVVRPFVCPASSGTGSDIFSSPLPRATWGGDPGGPSTCGLRSCRMSKPAEGGTAPPRPRRSGRWLGGTRHTGVFPGDSRAHPPMGSAARLARSSFRPHLGCGPPAGPPGAAPASPGCLLAPGPAASGPVVRPADPALVGQPLGPAPRHGFPLEPYP